MSHIDVVGTGRRVRKFVGFVGLVLAFAAFWLGHTATETWNAACPPGVTISDVNHGAGGPECGKSAFYWFCAAAALLASAWGHLGLARDVDREPLDRRQEMKPARQMSLSAFPSARGYIPPPDNFRRTDGPWKSVCRGVEGQRLAEEGRSVFITVRQVGRFSQLRPHSTSMGRPPRRLLVLALQQQVDRFSDERRGVSVSRVRDHISHPVPRRLIEAERDDQRLSRHSLSSFQ
jgi:hypothetical protein